MCFELNSIVFRMPIQQKLTPPELLFFSFTSHTALKRAYIILSWLSVHLIPCKHKNCGHYLKLIGWDVVFRSSHWTKFAKICNHVLAKKQQTIHFYKDGVKAERSKLLLSSTAVINVIVSMTTTFSNNCECFLFYNVHRWFRKVSPIVYHCEDKTVSFIEPRLFFSKLTAVSWETPSKDCSFTAKIWSPRFRRLSLAAAPLSNTVFT